MENTSKVIIREMYFKDSIGILFYQTINGKKYVARPVNLKFEEVKEDESLEPTLEFHRQFSGDFMNALAEALDNANIKTENDFKIKGLLEAKDNHLEDMRRIVGNQLGIDLNSPLTVNIEKK